MSNFPRYHFRNFISVAQVADDLGVEPSDLTSKVTQEEMEKVITEAVEDRLFSDAGLDAISNAVHAAFGKRFK